MFFFQNPSVLHLGKVFFLSEISTTSQQKQIWLWGQIFSNVINTLPQKIAVLTYIGDYWGTMMDFFTLWYWPLFPGGGVGGIATLGPLDSHDWSFSTPPRQQLPEIEIPSADLWCHTWWRSFQHLSVHTSGGMGGCFGMVPGEIFREGWGWQLFLSAYLDMNHWTNC